MESVAPYSLFIELIRNCVLVRDPVMATMEGGVEARHLRQGWKIGKERFDRCEIVGLMKRRQRDIALQARNQPMIDRDQPVVIGTTMDHDARPPSA